MTLYAALLIATFHQSQHSEIDWSQYLCANVCKLDVDESCEFRLPDGTRVDIYDQESGIAWEVEWCSKADAAFGQSARYANILGCEPGVWLLVKRGDDEAFLRSILSLNELTETGKVIHFRWTDTKTGQTFKR